LDFARMMAPPHAEYGRERAEVIVDTATCLAAASVGLDVSRESVPYVAGWGEDGALEAVTEFAKTIDELAKRIEDAIAAPAPADAPAELASAALAKRPRRRAWSRAGL
jgi:hypothetical protein